MNRTHALVGLGIAVAWAGLIAFAGQAAMVKAEIRVEVKDVKANLTTTFRNDERLGMDVPNEFREEYDLRDSRVSGVASYTRSASSK